MQDKETVKILNLHRKMFWNITNSGKWSTKFTEDTVLLAQMLHGHKKKEGSSSS